MNMLSRGPRIHSGAPEWNTLKTTFLNVKLQMLCKSHHLQCITSSKDSAKLEKSLCVRDKAEDFVGCRWSSGPQTTLHHPCISTMQDNAKTHTAAITTAWLCSRRVRVLNWPACSLDLSPIENIWCIIKRKIRQRRPQTLQRLETYIRQEWDQIPTPKLQKLITSMPRHLQTVLKRGGDATPW